MQMEQLGSGVLAAPIGRQQQHERRSQQHIIAGRDVVRPQRTLNVREPLPGGEVRQGEQMRRCRKGDAIRIDALSWLPSALIRAHAVQALPRSRPCGGGGMLLQCLEDPYGRGRALAFVRRVPQQRLQTLTAEPHTRRLHVRDHACSGEQIAVANERTQRGIGSLRIPGYLEPIASHQVAQA